MSLDSDQVTPSAPSSWDQASRVLTLAEGGTLKVWSSSSLAFWRSNTAMTMVSVVLVFQEPMLGIRISTRMV